MLLLDSESKERVRLEGYLPNNDFVAALMSGLGRIAFVQKKYSGAERWYTDLVARFGNSHFAAEAMYWRAVAHYKATNDHTVLGKVAERFSRQVQSDDTITRPDFLALWKYADTIIPILIEAKAECAKVQQLEKVLTAGSV